MRRIIVLFVPCCIAFASTPSFTVAATNWALLSPTFESKWSRLLPAVPTTPLSISPSLGREEPLYVDPSRGDFQYASLNLRKTANLSRSVLCSGADASVWPDDAIKAGPLVTCGVTADCCDTCGCNNNACNANNAIGSAVSDGCSARVAGAVDRNLLTSILI